jgi:geranylgeranyl pyrophosphate synthase
MDLELELKKYILKEIKDSDLQETVLYSLIPAGKLFRPNLFLHLLNDLNISINQDHLKLALALELHHAYTLIHDDLPCMDNDTERRGKPTAHIQFNEWKALLAGDTLLILSFKIISHLSRELAFFTWATGPKGLILGQKMDLNLENKNFQNIIRLHELKTARLLQTAIFFATKDVKLALKLGSAIGISFQLMDDKNDLKSEKKHELALNPWHQYRSDCEKYLAKNQKTSLDILQAKKFNHTLNFINTFFKNN